MNTEKELAMENALEEIKSRLAGIATILESRVPKAGNDDGDVLRVVLDSTYFAFGIADKALE
ncbi:MAG: hypothetical protein J6O13_09745 [Selenomonas sp.]|nr:hypothetical protein [Selenomonas sp.]